ncbi:putative membrane fusion protein [Caldanaerobius fijiensis DSM 17918]|uniref:Putative membrane fusion protein n=1 Tax=Caldanaerobius fijiensis DSM 17918 TaxID=1121256 RepID=A0A1M4SZ70_9THEO|nr:HlyD family efflux transporter periplasmic adaptor subunit [Caldanaerobius fijiensis]SHE37548.1 putative membrane fusion protein [Caldanaerobius fijiensis DSM 17918]
MKKKIRALFIFATVVILAYFILKFQFNAPKIGVITYGRIEEHFYVDAHVFYDQEIINAPIGGRLIKYGRDGERVSKGSVVARIDDSEAHIYREKIKDIDKQIDQMKNMDKGVFTADIAKINNMIDENLNRLQDAIKKGDTKSIEKYKQDIQELNDKKSRITKVSGVDVDQVIQLLRQKDEIMSVLDKKSVELMATKPGLLHYISNRQDVSAGQPVVGLIDNYKWYISIDTNRNVFKPGDSVSVEFSDYGVPVKFYVSSVKREKSTYHVVLYTTYYVKDFYKKSTERVKIILNDAEGLKIPESALTEKEGKIGVYVLREKPVFCPVKVIASYGGYAIIENQEGNNALKAYDKVIIYRRGENSEHKR